MAAVATVRPHHLSQLNERSVLRILQARGPCSRAEVTRHMKATAPTVSKAVSSLLDSGLIEESAARQNGRGRPAKTLRLATTSAQVLGLVIDAGHCRAVAAGLDGRLHEETTTSFPTPGDYAQLIRTAAERLGQLAQRDSVRTLGLGISMPGLIDDGAKRGLLSPNLAITNGHQPGRDLSSALRLPAVLLQESHALCLAERHFGMACDRDDFAILDASTGMGLGVMLGGRLLKGQRGLAGEIGHLPIEPNGPRCGCGRRGCLETLASGTALARLCSRRRRRAIDIGELFELHRARRLSVKRELAQVGRHLAFALATVINLFDPSMLLVHGRMFDLDRKLFDRIVRRARQIALKPSVDRCQIGRAHTSKRQGAVAGIIEHLTDARIETVEQRADALLLGR